MLDSKGQSGGMIKTIFIGVILAVVLGMATSQIVSSMPTTNDHSLEVTGTGTENIAIGTYKSVDNGTLTVDYDMSAGDNISVKLNGTYVLENHELTASSGTIENSVDDLVQEGTNTLEVSLLTGGTYNSLTTTYKASVDTDILGVLPTAKNMGPTIVTFIFLGLLVLAIVGLIRYFRAV